MLFDNLIEKLRAGEVIVLEVETWKGIQDEFTLIDEHDTCMMGMLSIEGVN